MSATAKTLASLGIALVGLIVYLGIFIGMSVFHIAAFGYALYLGLALTAIMLVVVVVLSVAGGEDAVQH
jgi:hypothetical protein